MTKTLTIIGAGEFGRFVADLASECGYNDFVYFDDSTIPERGKHMGAISNLDTYLEQTPDAHLALAIGYKHFDFRIQFIEKYGTRAHFPTLIHPTAFVSNKSHIGKGCFVCSMSNIEFGAVVGDFVSILNQTSITHDVRVSRNCFFSVGVAMGGRVQFGESCFIGVNAIFVNDITIGDGCTICAGTLLSQSIPQKRTVIGNPFKEISGVTL